MAKKETKEVATKTAAGLPAEFEEQFLEDASEFEENLTQADMQMPFLQIIQAMSPQVTEGNAQFLEDVHKGEFFNTVTKESWSGKEGVLIIPCFYKRSFIEWVPRNAGGGFVNEFSVEEGMSIRTERDSDGAVIILEGNELGTSGNQLVDTATHYILALNPETNEWAPSVVTMAASQFKVSRNLNSQIAMRSVQTSQGKKRAPRFWDVWRANTVVLNNDSGSWYGWDLKREGVETRALEDGAEIYELARSFARSVKAGEKAADHAKAGTAAGDKDIPF